MLRFNDLVYWSVHVLQLQVLGKEEKENPLVVQVLVMLQAQEMD